jgi:hypothetical protein
MFQGPVGKINHNTAAAFGIQPRPTAVRFGNRLHDGEPEPGAAALTTTPEPLKGALGKFIAEAWSGIANKDLHPAVAAARGQLDVAIAVQQSVVDEAVEQLLQSEPVSVNREPDRRADQQPSACLDRSLSIAAGNGVEQPTGIDRLSLLD